jgi:hypothetical protein
MQIHASNMLNISQKDFLKFQCGELEIHTCVDHEESDEQVEENHLLLLVGIIHETKKYTLTIAFANYASHKRRLFRF